MSTVKRLALIAAGYALCVVAGLAAVALNELRIAVVDAQASSGMVAFGDMILFVFVTGFFGLAPTWFLLKLLIEKAPRVLLAIMLLVAAMGPASWLSVTQLADGSSLMNLPQAIQALVVQFIAFVAFPRMVLGPVLLVIEAVTFLLVRGRVARALLAVAMLMDLVPLGIFALHFLRATRY
jgi:hypothetical protein